MAKPEKGSAPASQKDIQAFTAKLTEWSKDLPAEQQSIAQLLVEMARDLHPETVAISRITADLRTSARAIISALNLPAAGPQGWVRIDPVWERKDKIEFGEDIEILQRLFVSVKR
jgi:hypothetical protein